MKYKYIKMRKSITTLLMLSSFVCITKSESAPIFYSLSGTANISLPSGVNFNDFSPGCPYDWPVFSTLDFSYNGTYPQTVYLSWRLKRNGSIWKSGAVSRSIGISGQESISHSGSPMVRAPGEYSTSFTMKFETMLTNISVWMANTEIGGYRQDFLNCSTEEMPEKTDL